MTAQVCAHNLNANQNSDYFYNQIYMPSKTKFQKPAKLKRIDEENDEVIVKKPKPKVEPKKVLKKSTTRDVLVSEAIIRPTGLIDPIVELRPIEHQVDDILEEVRQRVLLGQRVLITALTKKFAEELDLFFKGISVKSAYIHSDVETLDRLDILADLRRGRYDVLIGINLLREGLDLPEVGLVAIFDADKEGFLRSKTSLIQIIGRAARHSEGKVIMYANRITDSMQFAIDETNRRRGIQTEYNLEHGIVPKSTTRNLKTIADEVREDIANDYDYGKSGATLTTTGFSKKSSKSVPKIGLDDFEISNNYYNENAINSTRSRRKTGLKSDSIHGPKPFDNTKKTGKQVFDSFDELKNRKLEDLRALKLSSTELQERLTIAIDAMDFEMAAAIRDLQKTQ
jgi:excinuclease UvrABC helicase subunit UvrB